MVNEPDAQLALGMTSPVSVVAPLWCSNDQCEIGKPTSEQVSEFELSHHYELSAFCCW